MESYTDKLQELGIEALEENKDTIKKALIKAQLEMIDKSPQLLEKVIEGLFSDTDEE